MNFVVPDFYPAAAEIFVAVMALVIMLASTFARSVARNLAYLLTQATLIAAAFITIFTMEGEVVHTFSNLFISDLLGDVLKLMIYFSTAIALLYGRGYLADRKIDKPEYYLLALLMTLGMMVMVTANHMLPMYIGLEMMSLALYTMVAFDRDSARSTEAAMKYFVLGALASGLLLYGMSMVYGATGTLEFSGVAQALYNQTANQTVLMFGVVFLVAGICFKLGVVPFHMWVPDVYQGAPTAVTLVIATAPKLAAFAMAVRLLIWALFDIAEEWQMMLMLVAAASIVLGNLAAIAQQNIKRMLAYSGISHMGFMLLGLLAGVVEGDRHFALNAYSSAMFYAISYVIMSLASFGMLILLSRAGFEAENIDDFKGLNKRSSWYALMMLFVMFSMAGVPFFIGFFAKLSVLQAVVAAGYFWLAVLAVVMSVIGAFYYLRVVKVMYFDEPVDSSPIHAAPEVRVMLSANGLAIAALGLAPQALMSLCAFALLRSL
ncbi:MULTISPECIES: NADH-quinone oxidoreductase subunit NuoN [Thauera]|mgnify:FL=1|uniref:NADH-quinone oxidoreductase subunit N n=2 Tax=Thauera aminoaromatica TaxID=164330 RepID=N6Y4A9_THASP|nr:MULTISPECIES: NADH-quinone oxidoreductase subunit NuoN [Thauera]MDA0233851.1 NADH-quinone oxidoreductase subunit NuoN [Pseudomonadota bacterium]ENO86420.1 NADH:ubiquinone oxidoreductase subunit N [Thauera aminoaromatica S2]KIN89157.1 proton-translocating NADH-quinone oxidoreductase, chain N family protein [Thauera sp. SWB20]TXH83694.1 MAG: NADH-quinone oxidoreductase subunit NuoN [Thauera aminoaromatica]HMU16660.1 NADH-quinone oxidoreductase subunit NuoN [Thauera aminoaromatica]